VIAYLTGTVKKKFEKSIILDVNGVGYLVYCTMPAISSFGEINEIELYIFTKVREDDISLYGFENFDELEFFKLLLTVNGVGAKTAMDIMSQNLGDVKKAILSEDSIFLSKIQGIGKKTAERIIVDLKGKVNYTAEERIHTNISSENSDHADAMTALMNLGYQKYEIQRVLRTLPAEITEAEEVVTYFLRNI